MMSKLPLSAIILEDEAIAARRLKRMIHEVCGEEIVVPIDLTQGSSQVYVEDCPVCCRANVIHVEVDGDGDVRVWAEAEW